MQVAERFGKRHDRVLRSIEELKKNSSPQNWGQCFKESTYKDDTGRTLKKYIMNRDGFSLLVMGFTGKKALEWKWKYIKAFNQMEALLRERATLSWEESRRIGKLTRQAETDVIQQLIGYAKEQGSAHADKLYLTYSKLANRMAGVSKRDEATVAQLNNLSMMEHIILCTIRDGMGKELHYKQIFQECKKRLELVSELAYLGPEQMRVGST